MSGCAPRENAVMRYRLARSGLDDYGARVIAAAIPECGALQTVEYVSLMTQAPGGGDRVRQPARGLCRARLNQQHGHRPSVPSACR